MEIILYSTGCPRCGVLEKKLKTAGINYKLCTDEDYMAKIGITQVPCLQVKNHMYDFKKAVDWVNNGGDVSAV